MLEGRSLAICLVDDQMMKWLCSWPLPEAGRTYTPDEKRQMGKGHKKMWYEMWKDAWK